MYIIILYDIRTRLIRRIICLHRVSYVRNPSSLATTRRHYLHRILLKNVLQTHNIILLLLYGRVVIARALMRCLLSMIVDRAASFRIIFLVLYILYNIYYLIVRQAYTLYLHKLLSEEDTAENCGKTKRTPSLL
jgi:hypothetical protein